MSMKNDGHEATGAAKSHNRLNKTSPSEWAARAIQNSSQPISQLPTEILSYIFVLYAHEIEIPSITISSTDSASGPVLRRLGSGWLDVTQVCVAWRTIAHSTPALWSHHEIPFELGHSWCRYFLARSGSRPIKVSLDFRRFISDGIPTWATDLLKEHIHRIGRLAVGNGSEAALPRSNIIKCLVRDTAPQGLTSLSLWFARSGFYVPSSDIQCLLSAPSLRTLSLHNFTCDVSGSSWPNLRSLTIQRARVDPTQMSKALSTAPLLETLALSAVRPSSDTALERVRVRVPLRNLFRFDLWGEPKGIAEMLTNLVLPPLRLLSITVFEVYQEETSVDTVLSLLQYLRTHLLSVETSGRAITKYQIESYSDFRIEAISHYDRERPFDASEHNTALHFSATHKTMRSRVVKLSQLLRAFPMGHCEVLDISTQDVGLATPWLWHPWPSQTWSDMSLHAANVHTLRVFGSNAHAVVREALAGFERDTPTFLWPSLRALHLYEVSFEGETAPFLTQLVSWLRLRKTRGMSPIRTLILRDCHLYEGWWSEFDDLDDVSVDWDGRDGTGRVLTRPSEPWLEGLPS